MVRNFIIILASISFIIVIGGAVYEHRALVPVWSSAVPASLTVFQGEYRLTPEKFWVPIHPVTVVLMIAALVANWASDRRALILAPLVGYVVVLAITFFYFVPELMAITQTPFSETVDAALTARASTWETLSLVRLGSLILMAISLLSSLATPIDSRSYRRF
ncbi:MAG: hypothetical protein ABIR33_14140 [Pyrinomonadaceae bacterium]